MKFEWDEEKNLANIEKHGFDFNDAEELFAGPMLTAEDDRNDYGEERWIGVGMIQGRVAVVTFTERGDNTRIISLRKATRYERDQYEKAVRDQLGNS